MTWARARLALVVLLAPSAARAHLVNTGLGPIYDGVAHLAVTPEDLLPALAMALLAGQRGATMGRHVLLALPAAWLVGGVAGLWIPAVAGATTLTTASLLALGALVAAEAKLRPAWVMALAGALGLLHGSLDGASMAQARLGALGLAGIVGAVFVLVALASALVVSLRAAWSRVAVRVAGSWIVAVGLLTLGWSLRS